MSTVPVTCGDQAVLTPDITRVYGCEVPARRRAISGAAGQTLTIDWQFIDPTGRAVDLTSCGTFVDADKSTGWVELRSREALGIPGSSDPLTDVIGSVTSASTGQATFDLPALATRKPGIYMAEAAVFNTAGTLVFTNQFHLIINRSLFSTSGQRPSGIPSVAEIRLHLRDSDPADNTLLESVQFDLAEIAAAIEYPILYWNEAPPPVAPHTTTNFPYRFHWLEAIIARLYQMAAHFYRRNHLQFSSQGGIGTDDLNKANEYEAKAKEKWDLYRDWVRLTKVRLNAMGAIQSSWPNYGYGYGWGGYGW